MKDKIDFSVAMSVYKNDNPSFFRRALESITDLQTVKPSEIILVVDGPIGEGLIDVIKEYEIKCGFFKTIYLKKNLGLGNALKVAIDHCTYELIARMDSDDISLPNRFEEQLLFFEQNQSLDIVGGNISEFVDTEDNIVAYRCVPFDDKRIKEYLKKRCPFNHMSVMYKKEAVQRSGGYLDWFYNEDYFLWIRMAEQKCIMANTGTVLVNVRVGNEMYQRRGGIKYFKSEAKLQKYMRDHKLIGMGTYLLNVSKRLIVQVLLPNKLRGWVFKKIARKMVL